MKVEIRTNSYRCSHDKLPRGTGSWFFFTDRRQGFDLPYLQVTATYGEAAKAARAWAKAAGYTELYVGS